MPWQKFRLRDGEVLARVDALGIPVVTAGRVEVRYGPNVPKAYRAALGNLAAVPNAPILPDSHCVDISESAAISPAKKGAAAPAPTAAPEGTIIAYTDGACSGNPGPAGLGVVLIETGSRIERSEYLGNATNNVAELTAIFRAVELSPDKSKPLVVHTDSQYSIGVLTKGWKAKANPELIVSIKRLIAERGNVRIVYVPAHVGVVLNERADTLAREAVTSRRTTEQRYESARAARPNAAE
ncbi:MAG: ribonuclease H [Deltaproteobacteria bacterium]|nr:ribonuclease H [Deltaproteobacteria bacterium]